MEIKCVQNRGISIIIDGVEKHFSLNFYGFNADLPAKAMALNMVSHGGYFSCPFCLLEGSDSHFFNNFIYFNLFLILFDCKVNMIMIFTKSYFFKRNLKYAIVIHSLKA